ncbi:hypothetical protein [Spiroplasma ixodetis]|uniref:hypothetical protein n=1 Tax=Spiroplasma ixodetis TaxID=2141 RepID=UPI002576BE3B|nr:hypothetical protein [Spiroplasma ixodetis]
MSINKGLNDDYKILLPYYFELTSNPIHSKPDKIWEFKDAKVILKSEYFDFTDINNIKLRTSPHMYLWRKQWNWMSSTMLFKQNRIV